jgi:hypothetical protein
MPTVSVTFQRCDVHNDGEPLEKGKFYWTLNINGATYTLSQGWGEGPGYVRLRDRRLDTTLHCTIGVN